MDYVPSFSISSPRLKEQDSKSPYSKGISHKLKNGIWVHNTQNIQNRDDEIGQKNKFDLKNSGENLSKTLESNVDLSQTQTQSQYPSQIQSQNQREHSITNYLLNKNHDESSHTDSLRDESSHEIPNSDTPEQNSNDQLHILDDLKDLHLTKKNQLKAIREEIRLKRKSIEMISELDRKRQITQELLTKELKLKKRNRNNSNTNYNSNIQTNANMTNTKITNTNINTNASMSTNLIQKQNLDLDLDLDLNSSLNLEPFLLHAQQIESLINNSQFDNSVEQFTSDMSRISSQMKQTLKQVHDVKETMQNKIVMNDDSNEMKKIISKLKEDIATVQLEKQTAQNIHKVLTESLKEKDKAIVGALRNEDMKVTRLNGRIKELELIAKKQQETMLMVIKIAQYKQISLIDLLELYQKICNSYDKFRESSKGNDSTIVEKLNKLHQDFLLDSIRISGNDDSSDLELVKIIIRSKKNSLEAREWIERRIEESKLENQVRVVLDKVKENDRLIQKSQKIQKQPEFLNSNDKMNLLKRRFSFMGFVKSPEKKNVSFDKQVDLPKLDVNLSTSETSVASTLGSSENNIHPSPLYKMPTQPPKTMQQIITDMNSNVHEMKKSKSSSKITFEEPIQNYSNSTEAVKNIVMEPSKFKNIEVEDLQDKQEEMIEDLERFTKLRWTEEEIQNDLEQERDLYERAKTLSMYYREKEKAARNEKELEAEQITILKDLEILEKKRLQLTIGKYLNNQIEDKGERCFVILKIYELDKLWNTDPFLLSKSIEVFTKILSAQSNIYQGTVVKGKNRMVVFTDLLKAVSFAIELQIELNEAQWPTHLQRHRESKIIKNMDNEVIFRGLRISATIHIGCPIVLSSKSGNIKYKGASVERALLISEKARFGEILLSSSAYQYVKLWNLDRDLPCKAIVRMLSVEMIGDNVMKLPEVLRVIIPEPLKDRFSYHNTNSNLQNVNVFRIQDLYPMIETLIRSAKSTSLHESDRDVVLNILKHVHIESANTLSLFKKDGQYSKIVNKKLQLRNLVKRAKEEKRNLNLLKENFNSIRDEFDRYQELIMYKLNRFSRDEQKKSKDFNSFLMKLYKERDDLIQIVESYSKNDLNNSDSSNYEELKKLKELISSMKNSTPQINRAEITESSIQTDVEEKPVLIDASTSPRQLEEDSNTSINTPLKIETKLFKVNQLNLNEQIISEIDTEEENRKILTPTEHLNRTPEIGSPSHNDSFINVLEIKKTSLVNHRDQQKKVSTLINTTTKPSKLKKSIQNSPSSSESLQLTEIVNPKNEPFSPKNYIQSPTKKNIHILVSKASQCDLGFNIRYKKFGRLSENASVQVSFQSNELSTDGLIQKSNLEQASNNSILQQIPIFQQLTNLQVSSKNPNNPIIPNNSFNLHNTNMQHLPNQKYQEFSQLINEVNSTSNISRDEPHNIQSSQILTSQNIDDSFHLPQINNKIQDVNPINPINPVKLNFDEEILKEFHLPDLNKPTNLHSKENDSNEIKELHNFVPDSIHELKNNENSFKAKYNDDKTFNLLPEQDPLDVLYSKHTSFESVQIENPTIPLNDTNMNLMNNQTNSNFDEINFYNNITNNEINDNTEKILSNDSLYIRARSDFVNQLRDLSMNLKNKLGMLDMREQIIRKQENDIKKIFNDLLSLYKQNNSNNSIQSNSPNAYKMNSPTIHSSMNSGSPSLHPSIKNTKKPVNLKQLHDRIVNISKELSDLEPVDQELKTFVNGNYWLETLAKFDPKHIFQNAQPYKLKNYQLFGPSSLNPQDQNKILPLSTIIE